MARINIEDALHTDVRFAYLVRKVGDQDKAIGMLYRFWRYAQRYWADGKKLIPLDFFELEGLKPIAEVGLAEIKPEGVYARGSIEQFEWYREKRAMARAAAMKRWHPDSVCEGNADAYANELLNACPLTPAPTLSLTKKENTYTCQTEEITQKDKESLSDKSDAYASEKILKDLWNSECKALAKITSLSTKRVKSVRLRWKENPSEDYWRGIIRRIAQSDFCNGRSKGSNGWRADFDWLIKPDTHLKVSEGKYDNAPAERERPSIDHDAHWIPYEEGKPQ